MKKKIGIVRIAAIVLAALACCLSACSHEGGSIGKTTFRAADATTCGYVALARDGLYYAYDFDGKKSFRKGYSYLREAEGALYAAGARYLAREDGIGYLLDGDGRVLADNVEDAKCVAKTRGWIQADGTQRIMSAEYTGYELTRRVNGSLTQTYLSASGKEVGAIDPNADQTVDITVVTADYAADQTSRTPCQSDPQWVIARYASRGETQWQLFTPDGVMKVDRDQAAGEYELIGEAICYTDADPSPDERIVLCYPGGRIERFREVVYRSEQSYRFRRDRDSDRNTYAYLPAARKLVRLSDNGMSASAITDEFVFAVQGGGIALIDMRGVELVADVNAIDVKGDLVIVSGQFDTVAYHKSYAGIVFSFSRALTVDDLQVLNVQASDSDKRAVVQVGSVVSVWYDGVCVREFDTSDGRYGAYRSVDWYLNTITFASGRYSIYGQYRIDGEDSWRRIANSGIVFRYDAGTLRLFDPQNKTLHPDQVIDLQNLPRDFAVQTVLLETLSLQSSALEILRVIGTGADGQTYCYLYDKSHKSTGAFAFVTRAVGATELIAPRQVADCYALAGERTSYLIRSKGEEACVTTAEGRIRAIYGEYSVGEMTDGTSYIARSDGLSDKQREKNFAVLFRADADISNICGDQAIVAYRGSDRCGVIRLTKKGYETVSGFACESADFVTEQGDVVCRGNDGYNTLYDRNGKKLAEKIVSYRWLGANTDDASEYRYCLLDFGKGGWQIATFRYDWTYVSDIKITVTPSSK